MSHLTPAVFILAMLLAGPVIADKTDEAETEDETLSLQIVPAEVGPWSAAVEDKDQPDRLFILNQDTGDLYEVGDYAGRKIDALQWRSESVVQVYVDGDVELLEIDDEGGDIQFRARSAFGDRGFTSDGGEGFTRLRDNGPYGSASSRTQQRDMTRAHDAAARKDAVRATTGGN